MRKLALLALSCFILTQVAAQSPAAFNYQGIARNSDGIPLDAQNITLLIELKIGAPDGPTSYSETHSRMTNQFGLFQLEIGRGSDPSGPFEAIEWGNNTFFLAVSMDPNGGINFQALGTTQLLSVPYALYAESSGSSSADGDTDATNELIQSAQLSGAQLSISDAGGTTQVDLTSLINDNDAETDNELIEAVTLDGTDLTITDAGGNSIVDLSPLVADEDADPANELQTLSLSGDTLLLSDGGSVVLPGPEMAIYSLPANALNFSSSSDIIISDFGGLAGVVRWTNSFSNGASFLMRKPPNYSGGAAVFKIFFQTTTTTAGTVEFFIRPRSYNSGDGFADAGSISENPVSVSGQAGFGTLYEQFIDVPASRLTNDWWYITIQRNSTDNTYPDDVLVYGIALEYPVD